jgi:serine/threonine protein kinase
MLDIVEGLNYLHTLKPTIIHGDIKGVSCMSCISRHAYLMGAKVNILITPSHRACLADFGVASCKDSTSLVTTFTPTAGTLRWQAPELLDPELDDASCRATSASDVYAYACVCYEVLSR